ncbi:MAG: DUF3000 domain-containing protein [Corynebacterium sp.]|nr:DUF3000 domain-containing protein [Corynebacterium sp.]
MAPLSGEPKEPVIPQVFTEAVESMHAAVLRPEISISTIRPPQKLAPFSHAIGLEVDRESLDIVPVDAEGDAFGRLILLFDPHGEEPWDSKMRLVAYIQADLEASMALDPMLSEVAWEWLTEGLTAAEAEYEDLGGTVTATHSQRFGAMDGPSNSYQLELRASWTAGDHDLSDHVRAFSETLAHIAGLPTE